MWLLAVAALVAACGGGAQGEDDRQQIGAAAPAPPGPAAVGVARGTLLQDRWSAYPRLVRLAHQADPARNGRIVASLTQNVGGIWQASFHASDDDGASFAPLGALLDGGFAQGLCCGTLFELPRAVGTLPAGTLLYSASVGADAAGTPMEHPLYRSDDGGASFARVPAAACGRSAAPRVPGGAGTGVWEPEFLLAADGSLACIYSDESEPGKSQVLKLTRTTDGATWSAPRVIVAGARASDRPGMAVVRRLPGGRYLMSLESCSSAELDCALRLKSSDDGLDWGPLGDLGARPRTAAGQFFRHAPNHAWMAVPGQPQGAIVLVGQLLATGAPGVDEQRNGRALMVGSAVDGPGDWRLVDAPIGLPVAPAQGHWCPNYSTALLPSADGTRLLMLQTDLAPDGRCLARFGQGALVR